VFQNVLLRDGVTELNVTIETHSALYVMLQGQIAVNSVIIHIIDMEHLAKFLVILELTEMLQLLQTFSA
jgi:hypothetical protein